MCIIPSHYQEVEAIYRALEAAAVQSACITAARSGEGVSTIAEALAHRYASADLKALIVDINLYNSQLSDEALKHSETSINWASEKPVFFDDDIDLFSVSRQVSQQDKHRYKEPGFLREQLQGWSQDYERIIFDTSPVTRVNYTNVPAELVASISDATLLVVMAGVTPEMTVAQAIETLKSNHAKLIGSVYNDRNNPSLANELIRETLRIESKLPKLATYLQKKVRASSFLNMAV